ncbi:MAG TPA: 3'(2'),5'-bisphosphate nucleotidase CysQ, partial [Polyangia bacterium]
MVADSSAYEAELAAARAIALDAADVVKSFAGRTFRIDSKPGDEPVTEADHAANELIVARLAAAFPHDAILSEELPDDGSRKSARRVWMVDPIDGTRDFILGDTGFCVMIGLCVDGRPHLGVVSQPSTGKTYSGVVGRGAWLDSSDGSRRDLHTSTLAAPPGIRLVASKSHRTPRVDAFRRALQIEDEMNIGSVGLKIGLVAEAARDLYIYTGGRTKVWDTCGPEAILVAAGGRVTDVDGAPLGYAGTDLYNRRGI